MKILKTYIQLFENKKFNLVLDKLKSEFGDIKVEETNNYYEETTYTIHIIGIKNLVIYYKNIGFKVSSMYSTMKRHTFDIKTIIDFIYHCIGGSLLNYYINAENWDKVMELIPIEKRINAQDRNGFSALHLLLMYEYDNLKTLILKRDDLNIELKDFIGNTPLLTAAENLGSDMYLLLKSGANLLAKNKYNQDFEYILTRHGFTAFLEDFIEYIETHVDEYKNCMEYVKYNKRKKFNL
jgi:hypothetical protein